MCACEISQDALTTMATLRECEHVEVGEEKSHVLESALT